MSDATLDALLRRRAAASPDKTFVEASAATSQGPASLTYAELDRRAASFAAWLRARGAAPGDRIVLGLGNTPEFFAALFGCFRAGLIAVPVDSLLARDELCVIVDHAEPRAIVADGSTEARFESLRERCPVLRVADEEPAAEAPAPPSPSPETGALLLYTSGTTGDPKGVLYSHAALTAKIAAVAEWLGFDDSYTSLCLLPTHFGHGLVCNSLSVLGYGGKLVITPPFNLDLLRDLWTIVDAHGVNHFSSVPTVVRLLLEYARQRPRPRSPSLEVVTCASAPLRREDVEAFEERFGVPLLNCYGLTEAAGWIACSRRDPDRDRAAVGHPLGCEIRIVGASGAALAPGELGEIQVRGASVMRGYYKHPAAAADAWLSTGDVGEIDPSGAIVLRSRIKELIIRAGKNVYPAEVDGVLMSHPDVVEACTVGLEDRLLGEKVAACVVRREAAALSEGDLIAYTQERLVHYKCPQRIAFVPRIPRTSRGKVNRANLRSVFEGGS